MAAKQKYQLWAEVLRDIGILFLVFAPLDTLLGCERRQWWKWMIGACLAIIGLVLINIGIKMEVEE